MKETVNSKASRKMVERSHQDPFFLGWALKKYETIHSWDRQHLSEWLECSPAALSRLSLCRLPQDIKERFQRDVQQVAIFAPCNVNRLIKLLREVASLSSLQEGSKETTAGLLMAARDRKSKPKDR